MKQREPLTVFLLRQEKNPAVIADKCGCSLATVYRFAQKEGVNLKLIRLAEQVPETMLIKRLVSKKISQKEVARQFGVSESYISKVVNNG